MKASPDLQVEPGETAPVEPDQAVIATRARHSAPFRIRRTHRVRPRPAATGRKPAAQQAGRPRKR